MSRFNQILANCIKPWDALLGKQFIGCFSVVAKRQLHAVSPAAAGWVLM